MALAVTATTPALAAPQKPGLDSAASAILIDSSDGSVILAKHPDERRSMASTTKLMTALLTLEGAKPSEVFTAANYKAAPIESKISLRPGERMTVGDLFEGMMLESANDAAITLAEGIAGSESAFVAKMNARARRLGLKNTAYTNPIGLDQGRNFSSARDLASLARRDLRDPRFAKVVDQPSAVLESGARRRTVNNRNDLVVRYPYVKGVKTGHTRKAGYVLVGAATSAAGAKVISVVMGEPSEAARDNDSLALLQYGLSRFQRRKVLDAESPVASAAIEHRSGRAKLAPAHDLRLVTRRGDRVRKRVDAPKQLGETAAGTRVGTIAVVRKGRVVKRVPLVTVAAVPGAGPLRVVADALGGWATVVLLLVVVCAILVAVGRTRQRRRRREENERIRARKRARAHAESQIE
jgi:D-alanyl-D-alanine carboxypeptidase (penicillin-binding protein 5/6)